MACVSSGMWGVGIMSNANSNRYSYLNNNKFSNNPSLVLSSSKGKRSIVASGEKESSSMATEIAGVKVINNPPQSKLADLGVTSWPKWGCPPSKFPWTYSAKETCYLLKGKVKVYPDGSNQAVEIGAGDLVEFPKGMSCTWDVSEEVDKHYKFE
ncbi:uncharacterized protein [Solanum tuberosum]|uniref:uncharacterized protein n=1 Tax=Solanum tuberosum TaxID=4113 RepID=UPI0003D26483|nr:PREDICTED: uncharacterized protein LOC102580040 [Solanum tuberosum]